MDLQIFAYFGLNKEFTLPNNNKKPLQFVNNFKYAIKAINLVKFCIHDIAI